MRAMKALTLPSAAADTNHVKRFFALVVAAMSAACGSAPLPVTTPSASVPLPRYIRVQVTDGGATAVREVGLEDYVQATAISEVSPAAGDPASVERMLEVQTIISRTYAVSHIARHASEGFDLCSTTHCQLYEPRRLQTSRWAGASAEAVAHTAGVILTFDRQPVQALFHADCGGYTSTSSAVWGGIDRPYLVARPDDGAAKDAHTPWKFEVTLEALTKALGGDARTRVQPESDAVALAVVSRDGSGRADRVLIEGRSRGASTANRTVRGDELRQVLSRAFGARAIRSTLFDIERRGQEAIAFSGRGFGHGVGLCQAGAFARLRAGATPEDVLLYYYPGAIVTPSRTSSTLTEDFSRLIRRPKLNRRSGD
jgi:stage II sporulation protein D